MPIFEFTEQSEVHTAWFCGWPGKDILAIVFRDSPESKWKGIARSRIHASNEHWDDNDRKRIWEIEMDDPEEICTKLQFVFTKMLEVFPDGELTTVKVGGTAEDFFKLWSKQPFVSVRMTPPPPKSIQ